MGRMRVMVVYGTRPELIKMAPVVRELRRLPEHFVPIVCTTAQHRDMLDPLQEVFELRPDHDLDLMRADQGLNDLAARAFAALDAVLAGERPDLVLIQGDTTTAMSGALAAFHRRIPVGHVEAGLRTGDLRQPFPEEANRRVVDLVAELCFAPTRRAADALLAEGVPGTRVFVTGNTVVDALFAVRRRLESDAMLRQSVAVAFDFLDPNRRLVLVTGHRRESFGRGFEEICAGLCRLAERDDVEIVYPVHLNPSVQGPVRRFLGGLPNVHLVEPLDYVPFVYLMMRSHIILTDSGGIQEEAPSLGKPVLVMREVTERPEALAAGTVALVGADRKRIHDAVVELLRSPARYAAFARAHNPYGDGLASLRIRDALLGDDPSVSR